VDGIRSHGREQVMVNPIIAVLYSGPNDLIPLYWDWHHMFKLLVPSKPRLSKICAATISVPCQITQNQWVNQGLMTDHVAQADQLIAGRRIPGNVRLRRWLNRNKNVGVEKDSHD